MLEAIEWLIEDNEFVDEASEGRRYFREMREIGTRFGGLAAASVEYFGGDTAMCLMLSRSSMDDFFE